MSGTTPLRSSKLVPVLLRPLLVATLASIGMAQSLPVTRDVNSNTWLVFNADQTIHGKWGVHGEVNVRRSNFADIWQQFQLHGAVTYRITPRVQLSGAYIWMRSYRYGDFPATRNAIERRTHMQLAIRQRPWRRFEFDHRIRLDQRWLQQFSATGQPSWRYENRARYQFRAIFPLSKVDALGRQTYLLAADEILYHLPPKRGARYFNQNRVIAGVGQRLSAANRIEFQYLHQFLYQRSGRVVESNHTIRIQFYTTNPLFWRRQRG